MDDVVAIQDRNASDALPRLDLQEHMADLEARGLLVRIDHPVDKDTELHPLVRLQFIGGIPEAQRRAFLFTNVVDGSGRRSRPPTGWWSAWWRAPAAPAAFCIGKNTRSAGSRCRSPS